MKAHRKRSKTRRTKSIAREDWDFSSIDREEAEKCARYESARSSERIKSQIEASRKRVGLGKGFDYAQAASQHFFENVECADFYWLWPEFPSSAFSKIPIKDRQQRPPATHPPESMIVGEVPFYVTAPLPQEVTALMQTLRSEGIAPHPEDSTEVLALLRFSWQDSDEKIVSRFREFIRKHRPEDSMPFVLKGSGDPGRRGLATLKGIGALRLVEACGDSWEDAHNHSAEVAGKPLYSNDQRSWGKAITTALEAIADEERSVLRPVVFPDE